MIESKIKLECEIKVTLTFEEAAALYDIAGYGYEAFIKVSQHEKGCKSLFEKIRLGMPKHISAYDKMKKLQSENQ